MLTDLNHLTLAVNNVNKSFAFYTEILGFKPLLYGIMALTYNWADYGYVYLTINATLLKTVITPIMLSVYLQIILKPLNNIFCLMALLHGKKIKVKVIHSIFTILTIISLKSMWVI